MYAGAVFLLPVFANVGVSFVAFTACNSTGGVRVHRIALLAIIRVYEMLDAQCALQQSRQENGSAEATQRDGCDDTRSRPGIKLRAVLLVTLQSTSNSNSS